MNYSFVSPRQIQFGWGLRRQAGEFARTLGTHAWIVLGSRTLAKSEAYRELLTSLEEQGLTHELLTTISREPEVEDVDRVVSQLRDVQNTSDKIFLLAVGGGAAIDLAKAAAAIATNRQGKSVRDFLEGVGKGLRIETAPLPLMVIPTTSGTGSEATKNAVISSYDPPFKKSLRSEMMVPGIVLIDPELTVTVSPETTAYSGMDAITQCIESYISRQTKPIPQALALQGLQLALPSLEEAVFNPQSREARERMSHAALLSGMALANSGLGMAHGVAAALGVHCRVPHGLACAVMLPTALQVNREVAGQQLCELANACGFGTGEESAERETDQFIENVESIGRHIGIPEKLSELGVERAQLPQIVAGSRGNSMSGNPRELSDSELLKILEGML
ncbi:MAG TPA: iron-containing alcohol dehydrogenase [Planctomycetaceae bacterium]|nr:iron-containing alcohol dehydrogenase [Planctomycetaceae bacterium]